MKGRLIMVKKIMLFLIVISLIASGSLFAQEPSMEIKNKLIKQFGPIVPIPSPDLRPSLWVNCCGNTDNICRKTLDNKGFLIVDDMNIYIYNAGNAKSTSATGKVEFFDVLTNSNKTINFTVGPVASKGWGTVTPHTIIGPFVIKKVSGIKISVTFKDSKGISKTNTNTQKECSILY